MISKKTPCEHMLPLAHTSLYDYSNVGFLYDFVGLGLLNDYLGVGYAASGIGSGFVFWNALDDMPYEDVS